MPDILSQLHLFPQIQLGNLKKMNSLSTYEEKKSLSSYTFRCWQQRKSVSFRKEKKRKAKKKKKNRPKDVNDIELQSRKMA